MVEFHLAKVGVRVRFPGDAFFFLKKIIGNLYKKGFMVKLIKKILIFYCKSTIYHSNIVILFELKWLYKFIKISDKGSRDNFFIIFYLTFHFI